ncbi:hypothetical protein PoMZ_13060, partial [Pyricularia oryzae]
MSVLREADKQFFSSFLFLINGQQHEVRVGSGDLRTGGIFVGTSTEESVAERWPVHPCPYYNSQSKRNDSQCHLSASSSFLSFFFLRSSYMYTGHSTFSIQVSAFPASREQKASPSHGPLPNSEVLPEPHLLLNVFWPPL